MRHATVFAAVLIVWGLSVAGMSGATGWNPKAAADYLDARQQAWFAWKQAASADGPCVSCHTGMTYLLARPALRRELGDAQPTMYEAGLLNRLRANAGAKRPSAILEVEVIFASMFLAGQDAGQEMSEATRKSFEQLWTLQAADGPAKGAWKWYAANLDPWEHSASAYYGASLAALAVARTPPSYRGSPDVAARASAIATYLSSSAAVPRPLHDRLAALWASSSVPGVVDRAARAALIEEVFAKQSADGGWTNDALGPWSPHADAPAAPGSSSYATAYTAYVLRESGVPASQAGMARALAWLRTHQDAQTGAWPAVSMNKRYPPGSMESLFMQDAATAFASLALLKE